MESKKSVQKLSSTIHSLLGLKARFTSTWVKSVCDIIRNLPPEGPSIELKSANLKTSHSSGNKDLDSAISKINGNSFLLMYSDVSLCATVHACRCMWKFYLLSNYTS